MATVTADAATSYKDQGNAKFKAGAYSDAIECYTKAIEVDADNSALYRCDAFDAQASPFLHIRHA